MAEAASSSSKSGVSGSGGGGGVRVPQDSPLKAGVALSDERVDFLREQAFCILRVKTDKWNRFIGAEENQKILLDFLDHIWTSRLLLFTGPGGTLHAGDAQVSGSPFKRLVAPAFVKCGLSAYLPILAKANFLDSLKDLSFHTVHIVSFLQSARCSCCICTQVTSM